jgi:hypothetical protein
MPFDPQILPDLAAAVFGVTLVSVGGWVFTTWLRVKNGYPLENSWGKPMLPHGGGETIERVKLLATENAQLKAELGSVKDRLEVLERIATDRGSRLAAEIDNLPPKQIN